VRPTFRSLSVSIALLLLLVSNARSGGPLGAVGTIPRTYPATSFPLGYRTDLGTLGSFSNTRAVSIASYAFAQWDNITSASLSFVNGGSLARDVTSALDPYISGVMQYNDGVNPIIFDTDGSITDAIFGVGARYSVLGFAGSAYAGTSYGEGKAVINGFLSGSGSAADQQRYEATITHEIGHFLGLAHPQLGMHAAYPTLYPYVISDATQRTLDPDDTAAMCQLYPTPGYAARVGSISGTVRRPNGTNLSGMNVVAVDSATGVSYSTMVDYFSGGDGPFDLPPAPTGSYTFRGLAPGTYFVRIEPIRPAFVGGSSVGSYDPPAAATQTVYREWYNGVNEGGDMLIDDLNRKTGVKVTAGFTSGGINIVANESGTLSTIVYSTTGFRRSFSMPNGSNLRFATRFTTPSQGSLVAVRLRIDEYSTLPTTGFLTIRVHQNTFGGLGGGVPGVVLDSVIVPYAELAAHQDNDIYLRSLGMKMDFGEGVSFHISIAGTGGTPAIQVDSGVSATYRSSYFDGTTWRSLGQASAPYNVPYNILMSAVWSTQPVGPPTPAIGLSDTVLDFGRVRPGAYSERSLVIRNDGTDTLRIASTSLLDINAAEFQIANGGGAFTVAPGSARTLDLRFVPNTTTGAKNASLSVVSNAAGSPHRIPLRGQSVMPQAAPISSSLNFGNVKLGQARRFDTLVLRNSGTDTLHIASLGVTGADADNGLTLLSNGGAVNLVPGGTLRAVVQFVPTERRTYSGRLLVRHDARPDSTSILLSGAGVGGEVALSNSGYDFGNQIVGDTSGSTPVVIRNTGNVALAVLGAQVLAPDAASFTLDTLPSSPTSIEPGDSLVLGLRFHPNRVGAFSTQVQIATDAPVPAATFAVAGNGVAPELVAPASFSLGASRVGSPNDGTVMLYNRGTAALTLTSLGVSGTNMPDFTLVDPSVSASKPAVVQPGDSLAVRLRFVPGALGARSATLTLESNNLAGARTIVLTGAGVEGSLIVSTTLIDFDSVIINSSAQQQMTVRNGGTAAVDLTPLAVVGADFSADPGTARTLAPGDSVVVTVRFAPTGAVGPRSGTITVQLAPPDVATVQVEVRGVAVQMPSGVRVNPILVEGLSVEMLPVLPSPVAASASIPLRLIGSGRVDAEVSIADITGRRLSVPFRGELAGTGAVTSVQVPLDCSQLPMGSYVAVLRVGGRARTQTFLVVR